MKILKIVSDVYDLDGKTVYAPTATNSLVFSVVTPTIDNVKTFTVNFIDSSNGFKYKAIPLDFKQEGAETYFNFKVDNQTTERAEIDFLELNINTTDNTRLNFKTDIKIKYIKKNVSAFEYIKVQEKFLDSNLLLFRNKISNASWSTSYKNQLSNTVKMLDALHDPFTTSYSKVNAYLKQAYSNLLAKDYSNIVVAKRPKLIIRKDKNIELKESLNLLASYKETNIGLIDKEQDLVTIIFERYNRNNEELKELNKLLPSSLYFKNDQSNEDNYTACVITGYNKYNEEIRETIYLRKDVFTKSREEFVKIKSLDHSVNTVVVSNFIDLSLNHYVINDPFIVPPIVDSNFRTFKPLVKKRTNEAFTLNTLNFYNPTISKNQEQLKFSLGSLDKEIKAAYVTDDLDIIYTEFEGNKTIINYSKLAIDTTKDLKNSVTNNNNPYVYLNNPSSSIGDWIEVTVAIDSWVAYTKDSAYIIQILNRDKIYYYDILSKDITTDKTINYVVDPVNKNLVFYVYIENEDPYIVNLNTSDLKSKVTASSFDNRVRVYNSKTIDGNYDLILFNNKLVLKNTTDKSDQYESDSDYLEICLKNYDQPLEYLFKFENYYINNNESNINADFINYVCKNNEDGLPTLLRISVDDLPNTLEIGLGVNSNNGIISELKSVPLVVKLNGKELYLSLTPTVVDISLDKVSIKIDLENMVIV